ncbi:MAG TPA: ComEA family DNA-binding protein, partial [Myxococcota bacterium]
MSIRNLLHAALASAVFAVVAAPSVAAQPTPVDINTASQAELESLPGIGPKIATDIIRERDENGPYASVDDLARVPTMTNAIMNKVKNLVRVGTAAPPPRRREETVVVTEGQVVSDDVVKKLMQRFAGEPTAREVQ